MRTIEPELLMRYADGDVSETARRAIETMLKTDPEASDLVAMFRGQNAKLRAMAPTMDDDLVLRRLERNIDDALAVRRRRRQSDLRRWALPIAASLVITLIGGLISLQLVERRVDSRIAAFLADQAGDQELVALSRAEALEQMVSGSPLIWANERSGTRGSITPLGTFQASDGTWCREYEEVITTSTAEERRFGIACRDADGRWSPPQERVRGI
ncbi:MAG: RT0821/Lpp0805 family surface protein [Pseudomonadota bacterium]